MKIGINCGHTVSGQPGAGAVGYLDESVETREVGKRLMTLFRTAGHTVYDCTDDYAVSENDNLSKIVNLANKQPLDLFVSIHFNSGGGRGTEVFTYGGSSFKEAENVCKAIESAGFVNRGIKDGSSLYVIRRTNAKSMLIEVCFVDTSDAEIYKRIGAYAVAGAIFKGITGKEVTGMAAFKDIAGHYAETHIKDLKEMGIVNGDENGNFRPNDTITRADAAIMVRNAVRYIMGK